MCVAVNDIHNIAPKGWHAPTDADWKELEMYLGMSQSEVDKEDVLRGTDEGGKLKEAGTIYWDSPNTGASNKSGFSALPGGYRHDNGNFYYLGNRTLIWSSTEYNSSYTWSRRLRYNYSDIYRDYYNKHYGFSVRLVRDN